MSKIKTGDKVQVVGNPVGLHSIGTVEGLLTGSKCIYRVSFDGWQGYYIAKELKVLRG